MAVTARALIGSKQAESVQTTQYTASAATAIIDKFTATNTGTANQTLSVNLVTSGGTAGVTNLIAASRSIAPGETYTFPEIVGHVLNTGGFISTLASSTGITIRASGREIT
jgi:hypothetical protein